MAQRVKNETRFTQLLVGMIAVILFIVTPTKIAFAAHASQDTTPSEEPGKACSECHLDVAENWAHSPHAHAYDDPYFQDRWVALGEPGECLLCHTTNYIASTGEYAADGVSCEACHGNTTGDHPPEVVSIRADTEYCGSCHTTTLSEWRSTAHHPSDVGCMDCHNPHSQQALFENPDDMCINCHQEDMERYLEDLHVQKDIGCVDCHALVIPPEMTPDDGIVPTGHSFEITPATCVACHTDALHAGFSLPGYENGASDAESDDEASEENGTSEGDALETDEFIDEEISLTHEQQIEALETALVSRNITTIFQGTVIGIVLGGSTAWIIARNIRNVPDDDTTDEEDEDGEETEA